MGFFSKLFKRQSEYEQFEYEETDWDSVSAEKEDLDMDNPVTREEFVRNCLDEMKLAATETEKLQNEYAVVTSYLTDMEEIEAIPPEIRKDVDTIARHIKDLRKNHDSYVLKESTMTQEEYDKIALYEDEVEEALTKIDEAEDFRDKVKKDLSRVDRERKSYDYRQVELSNDINNFRGVAFIAIAAAAVLVILLFLLQVLLEMNVTIGYYITVALIAVSLTFIYLKYVDSLSEKKKIDVTVNELILLENKVKIRYVNNRNLLDYYYLKYDISSAEELRKLYNKYIVEKEDRRKFEKNESVYIEEMANLVRELRKFRVKDPDIWIHQAEALCDQREMVEIRHRLIGRRQKLRKQIEYNRTIAEEAKDELKNVMARYPESKDSVMALIDAYEKEGL